MADVPEHLAAWETLVIPMRLNCWLAHVKGIMAIQFVNEKVTHFPIFHSFGNQLSIKGNFPHKCYIQELIVTGSVFGTVRLWTVMGSYIGAFGQERSIPWELPELVKAPSEEKIESVSPTNKVKDCIITIITKTVFVPCRSTR